MAKRIVVDNSVVMTWCFEDEASKYSDQVLESLTRIEALVPSIWPLEVANVLVLAERRGRIGRAGASRFVELLRALPIEIEVELPERVFSETMQLARDTGLTSYDASYLDLAIREGLPLATLDKAIRRAARKTGLEVFGTKNK
ncbi:MAG: type II toxin-antitoxin system VapC family toxin [Deltaproteobacteria bacterium]|nr:type II toxin-antitoxin system VapC family toxin [Deltaproteobacteria bacterium]